MHRLSALLAAGCLTVCLAGTAAAANPQPVGRGGIEPSDYSADGNKAVPLVERQEVGPAIIDRWELREYLAGAAPSSFGGLYTDREGATVIGAVGGRSDDLRALVDQHLGDRAHELGKGLFQDVTNPVARLEGLKNSLLRELPDLERAGTTVTSVGVDDVTNTLQVGLMDNADDRQSIVSERLEVGEGEVSFLQRGITPPAANRESDSAPFNAGDRIWNQNGNGCSSGFGVHEAGSGHDYLITAAHCSAVPGQADFFWNGPSSNPRATAVGFSTGMNFGSNGWDTQLIDAESSTVTWTANATRSYMAAHYKPVGGDPNRVINEGATSVPWQSGVMPVYNTDTASGSGPMRCGAM